MGQTPERQHVTECNPTTTLDQVARRRYRIVRRLLRWSRTNFRDFPWRDPGTSPYQVLIAELLLKRTTSTAAARLYPTFIQHYPSFSSVAEAPAEYLAESLRPIGLHHQRADGMKQLARYVCDTHGSELPTKVESLESLPHTGPYAARAVASFAFGKRAAVVDSNVVRILCRLFWDSLPDRPTAGLLQEVADCLAPKRLHRMFNYALLDLGATTCRYDRPRCELCPLVPVCDTGSR